MQDILIGSVQRFALFIAEVDGIDRVFGNIRAKSYLRDNGTLEMVVAIDAHCICVHRPEIPTGASVLSFHAISFCASSGTLSNACFICAFSKSKLLPGSMPMRRMSATTGWSVRCGGCS